MDTTTLAALAEFPRQIKAHFATIPADRRTWRPDSWEGVPSEPLSALEQLCHLRDVEIDGYHLRIRRILDEETPTLDSLDGERLAEERRYADADPVEVIESFRDARARTLQLLTGVSAAQRARTARFDGRVVTLEGLVHLLCSHDQQHLAGLQWLRALMSSEEHAERS